ncbi:39S ribosomal protein L37, mitochondrial-like [Amphibalanus amphitrite]|uniref:39S ribosomal protein L37, mitochondrial-like n=1 Tax=Amphibalanus amphitrite TaxID=1232801 RepID=UPI001C9112FD|nr:39S ribosomal protein L37, mitochondrial-like [Amphibalanus amphitrite]
MRFTPVLHKHLLGRWYNDMWKQKKRVTVDNRKLKQALEANGKTVYDAAKLFGVQWEDREPRVMETAVGAEAALVEPARRPEHHQTAAFVYQGRNLLLGQRQAQALTNTIQVGEGLPEQVTALEGLERIRNQDELVTDVIKTSLMFDATQEKLSKVIDVTRLGLPQPVQYGVPELRSNRSLLSGLLSLCERLAVRLDGFQSRLTLYRPLLSATHVTSDGHRLLVSRRPELALMADRPLPAPAPAQAVEASRAAAAPQLEPVSPFVHLHSVHDYQWRDVAPVSAGCRHRYVHTLFLAWNGRIKKWVDDDQLGALSVMSMHAAAVNMARQQAGPGRPAVVQCVATDGRLFKRSVLQLNTQAVPDPTSGEVSTRHQLKNLLWTEPAAPLYERCAYTDGRPLLAGYNAEVFARLLALYMNGLLARTVPDLN